MMTYKYFKKEVKNMVARSNRMSHTTVKGREFFGVFGILCGKSTGRKPFFSGYY